MILIKTSVILGVKLLLCLTLATNRNAHSGKTNGSLMIPLANRLLINNTFRLFSSQFPFIGR